MLERSRTSQRNPTIPSHEDSWQFLGKSLCNTFCCFYSTYNAYTAPTHISLFLEDELCKYQTIGGLQCQGWSVFLSLLYRHNMSSSSTKQSCSEKHREHIILVCDNDVKRHVPSRSKNRETMCWPTPQKPNERNARTKLNVCVSFFENTFLLKASYNKAQAIKITKHSKTTINSNSKKRSCDYGAFTTKGGRTLLPSFIGFFVTANLWNGHFNKYTSQLLLLSRTSWTQSGKILHTCSFTWKKERSAESWLEAFV